MKTSVLAITILILGSFNSIAQSAGVWSGNEHYYEVVSTPQNISWTEAQNTAQQRGGYLATVTSQAENDFAFSLLPSNGLAYIGGYQSPNSAEPAGGWNWVTNEPFSYTNWNQLEPNNNTGFENSLTMYGQSGKWNDVDNGGVWAPVSHYVVEYNSRPQPKLFGIAIGQNDGHQARGDIAAQAVFDKLSSKQAWASVSDGNTSAPLIFQSNFTDHLGASVSSRLDSMQVKAGDTVVFFYNGHGGPLAGYGDGGETPVDLGLFGSHSSTDDEILASDLSDDDLYRLFNTDKWRDVRKIFLLDSCHSGGFIGSSASDVGDLEKLSNFALFASALEDGNAQGDPFDGQGIWSKYLLLPSLDDADLTTMSLQISINSRLGAIVDSFTGQTVPLFDMNAPGATALFSMTPYSIVSSDYDASLPFIPVPEPSTIILAFAGFLFAFLHRVRNTIKMRTDSST